MDSLVIIGGVLLVLLLLILQGNRMGKKADEEAREGFRAQYGKASTYVPVPEELERRKQFVKAHERPGQIDDLTWQDLDMDRLFARMNYAQSSCGEEHLYYTLRTPLEHQEELLSLEEKVQYFMEHEQERIALQLLFAKLGKLGKYSLQDYLSHINQLAPISMRHFVLGDVAVVVSLVLFARSVPLGLVCLMATLTHNVLVYFKQKGKLDPYLSSFRYLFHMLSLLKKMLSVLAHTPLALEEKKLREVSLQMKPFQKGSLWLGKGQLGTTGSNPFMLLLDYGCMFLFLDLFQFNRMLKVVKQKWELLQECLFTLGSLETMICIGLYRASLTEGYCQPDLVPASASAQADGARGISIEEGYHPLLEKPVKNSITHGSCVLITGSNASGKSTFLKMVAINLITAQTIHTVTAKSLTTCFCQVYSSLSIRDNLQAGDSYYMAEIKAIKRMLNAMERAKEEGKCVVCFLDEVLRGTNTVERIAAGEQILAYIARQGGYCYGATHDLELTQLLEPLYENYHFAEELEGEDVVFPYILMPGKAVSRNAIMLLQSMGFPRELVDQAKARATTFVETNRWGEREKSK